MNKNTYKDIARSNIVFGSVKILQMLIQLAKIKIVAIILGPMGMGFQSILTSSINTIFQFTCLGLPQSTVREISTHDECDKKSMIITIVRRFYCIVGIIACFLTILFRKYLSIATFGTDQYSWMFLIISFAVFLEIATNIELAFLQGYRLVKELARASLIGSILSLLLSLPFYYYWKTQGIPYGITIGYFATALIYYLCCKRNIKHKHIPKKEEVLHTIKSVVNLGIALMLSNCIMSLFGFLLNMYINRTGTTEDVGFYNASVTSTYYTISILTSVLASDFYPRLSSKIYDINASKDLLNSQLELLLFVISPIVSIMIAVPSLLIFILFSSDFSPIKETIQLMSISLIFRIVWHSLSYVILAKGDKATFLIVDAIIGNGIFFICNLLGYMYCNLSGIAYSYIFGSFLVMAILYFTCRFKYGITLNHKGIKTLGIVLIANILLLIIKNLNCTVFIQIIFICAILLYSFIQLNKRLGIICYEKKQ